MDPKRIVMLVVGASVMVLIFSAILVPIINDATKTDETFTNDGYFRYSSIESTATDELTIKWEYTNPEYITVGTDTVKTSGFASTWGSVIFGDDWTIRYNYSDNTEIQYLGPTTDDYILASVSTERDLTITLSGGTATISNGTVTLTAPYTVAYYPDNNGSMIMKKSNEVAYLLKDSSIVIANGSTYVAGASTGLGVHFEGTITDGYDFTLYRNPDSVEVSNVASNYTEEAKYVGLVKLSSITFDLTPDGGTSTAATYSYFLVPYEVTAELAVHPDSATNALLSAIPIIAMIGIVLAVVGVAIVGRNDY